MFIKSLNEIDGYNNYNSLNKEEKCKVDQQVQKKMREAEEANQANQKALELTEMKVNQLVLDSYNQFNQEPVSVDHNLIETLLKEFNNLDKDTIQGHIDQAARFEHKLFEKTNLGIDPILFTLDSIITLTQPARNQLAKAIQQFEPSVQRRAIALALHIATSLGEKANLVDSDTRQFFEIVSTATEIQQTAVRATTNAVRYPLQTTKKWIRNLEQNL